MSKSLVKSTSIVSAMTMVSRILGFVRDMLAAQLFGAGAAVDAFYIAFKIPNFMRALFAEGSFAQAFVPVLSHYRQQNSPAEVHQFIAYVAGNLTAVLFPLTLIGVLLAPLVVTVFAPGLDPTRFHFATYMLRITFPYLMLISLTAFAGSVLNSYGAFAIPAITPALLNICLISSALWLAPNFHVPVEAQAWGVFGAGVVQLFFQIPKLYRLGFLPRPRLNWRDPGVKRVLKLMLPALFGASVGQFSLLLNTIFASFLPVGSVTWLYYSDRLAYFPLGVFGVALATVVLPHLSRKYADKSPKQFMAALDWGLRCNLLLGIPAAVILLIIAGPIITTLFQYGKFHPHDVIMTRESVLAYALGLQAFMLVKLLASGFYARQDVRTPVKIAVVTVIANMLLNAVLIVPLAHAGLALATSLSAWLNALLLLRGLHMRGVYRFQSGWGWFAFALRVISANVVMAASLWYLAAPLTQWLHWHWQQRFLHLFLLLLLALASYILVLFLSGLRLRHLVQA